MECLIVKKVHGVPVTEFVPTPKMRAFALSAYCDPDFRDMEPEAVCEKIGIGKGAYKTFLAYNPYFEEWCEEIKAMLGPKNKKLLLESVGMERALRGDFQFWKPLAIREGVISPDRIDHGVAIPSNLGALRSMSDDQLNATENSIMAALRGGGDTGPVDLVEGPNGWERESDPGGAAPQREGSLVLAAELGADGEHALHELDAL